MSSCYLELPHSNFSLFLSSGGFGSSLMVDPTDSSNFKTKMIDQKF